MIRVLALVLGLALCALGYGLLVPLGPIGLQLTGIDLGPLVNQRAPLGAVVAAFGVLLAMTSVLPAPTRARKVSSGRIQAVLSDPEPNPGRGGPPAAKSPPPPVSPPFQMSPRVIETLAPMTPKDTQSGSLAGSVRIEDAAVLVSAVETEQPDIKPAYAPPQESFELVRNRLHQQVLGESWDDALATARRLPTLAKTDRDRMLAAQDVGDLARAHGRLDDAAEAYDDALACARAMHAAAPSDPAKVTLLADALVNAGDMAQEQGRLDAAIVTFEEAVALRREAAAASPDLHAQRILSITLERLADAREDRGHRMRALGLYSESLQIATQLAAINPERYHSDLVITEQRLAELNARIGR